MLKMIDINIAPGCNVRGTYFEGKNCIGIDTFLVASSIGKGSYIGSSCHFSRVSIGRYCSIGSRINVIVGNHPTRDWVSTHPAFFSCQKQAGFTYVDKPRLEEIRYCCKSKNYYVSIGNDVWIGDGTSILGGVNIGDGAIIGAHTLVTKDVEPYTIVGGVPAKLIRERFSKQEVQTLLKFQWWNKDEVWIKLHIEEFSEIKQFIRLINSEGREVET